MTFCYNGEEVVLFQSKCPVDGCNNNEDITWHHVGCKNGYKEYINSNGEIICTDCKNKFGFYETRFDCGCHGNYKPPTRNPQRLIAAFAIMGRLKTGGGKKFLRKLMNSLIDQCDDNDDDNNDFKLPIFKYDFDFK